MAMTALYIYAVTSNEAMSEPEMIRSVSDRLWIHQTKDLAVIYEPVTSATIEVTREAVEHHHRVVSSLWSLMTALPVQFGTVARSPDEIDELVKLRQRGLLRDLERLRGTYEFGITVTWDPGEVVASSPGSLGDSTDVSESAGTGYMVQKLAEYRRESELERIAKSIHAGLSTEIDHLAIETSGELLPDDDTAVRVRYLIRDDVAESFSNAVGAVRLPIDALKIHLIGPWPPYSFVTSSKLRFPGTDGAKLQ
jgi:hypothetical protein